MSMSSKLMDKIRNKKKEIQQRSGNREDVLRIPMGKHKFRILPAHPTKGEDAEFWADFGQHFVKSEERNERGNRKVKSVYVCTHHTFGKDCPICASIEDLIPQGTDDEQLEILEESKCNRAEVLLNVLHRTGDTPDAPKILQMTPSTFEMCLSLMEEYGDITNLSEGVDLIIERSGSGLNTKYSVMPAAKSKAVPESVLEQMTDLQEFVQQEHEEGLKRALTNLNQVVGILDAPMRAALPGKASGAAAAASAAVAAMDDGEDMATVMDAEFEEVKEPVKKAAGDGLVIDDDLAAVDAELAGESTSTAAASEPADAGGDDDMDALLAELEGL